MTQKTPEDESLRDIARQVSRKQAERDHPAPNPLRGFSTFGMIGWSIVVPTVGGAFLGLWPDEAMPQAFSWTIALILGGVAIGSVIAWAWRQGERAVMATVLTDTIWLGAVTGTVASSLHFGVYNTGEAKVVWRKNLQPPRLTVENQTVSRGNKYQNRYW